MSSNPGYQIWKVAIEKPQAVRLLLDKFIKVEASRTPQGTLRTPHLAVSI